MIDYGTSPRGGWLTVKGEMLRNYVSTKSADELSELTCVDQEYIHCSPDHCNCDEPCNNPLW